MTVMPDPTLLTPPETIAINLIHRMTHLVFHQTEAPPMY
jgi:hypothetical protein